MKRAGIVITILAAALLAGCATQSAQVQAALDAGKPIVMCTLHGQAYVVQSGLPVPLGQRMAEIDAMCARP